VKQVKQFGGVYTSPEISNGKKVELTEDQKALARSINEEKERLEWTADVLRDTCLDRYGKSGFLELTDAEARNLINYMRSWN
jgi:hypothetical protein